MGLLMVLLLAMTGFYSWMNGWVDSHAETWYPDNNYNTEVTFNDYR